MGLVSSTIFRMRGVYPATALMTQPVAMLPRVVDTPRMRPDSTCRPSTSVCWWISTPSRSGARDLLRTDHARVDTKMLVDLGTPARGAQRGVIVGQGVVTASGVEKVEAQIVVQAAPQREAAVIEAHALGRQVIGTDDRRVATGVAAADVALLEHGDTPDAMVARKAVGRGQAVAARADDHHVVARIQSFGRAEHAWFRIAWGETDLQQTPGHSSAQSQGDESIVAVWFTKGQACCVKVKKRAGAAGVLRWRCGWEPMSGGCARHRGLTQANSRGAPASARPCSAGWKAVMFHPAWRRSPRWRMRWESPWAAC